MRFAGTNEHARFSGIGAVNQGTAVMLPVSSRAAVANAIKFFQGESPALSLMGLGDEQAQGAAAGAATGAKVGSVIPAVGTVIGAVVGAVVGWLSTKKKPVRATAQQIAECRQRYGEYMQFAAETPDAPIPLDEQEIINLNWCFDAMFGPEINLRDPRWFTPDVTGMFIPVAKDIVRKIYATKVGDTVDMGSISFRDPKGRTLTFQGFSFVNPVFTDLKTFTDQYFQPMAVKMCEDTVNPRDKAACSAYYSKPEFKRWLYDLLAWAARTMLPNISEADFAAASHAAQQIGTSSRDVVSAVETIMGRAVKRNETAIALTQAGADTQTVVNELARESAARAPPVSETPSEELTQSVQIPTLPASVSEAQRGAAAQDIAQQLPAKPITAGFSLDNIQGILPLIAGLGLLAVVMKEKR